VTITATYGPWRAEWEGGRLADVYHLESDSAIHCIQVGEYDFSLPAHELEATRAHIAEEHVLEALQEWADEDGETYAREAVPFS
jgi:transposase